MKREHIYEEDYEVFLLDYRLMKLLRQVYSYDEDCEIPHPAVLPLFCSFIHLLCSPAVRFLSFCSCTPVHKYVLAIAYVVV